MRGLLQTSLVIICSVIAISAAQASRPDFAHYQVILQRKPFGEPPAPKAAPVKVQPTTPGPNSVFRNLRMCAITENPAGTRVGIVDIKSKQSYFLYVGDMEDGLELVEADFAGEKAKLRKGDEEYWLSMNNTTPINDSGVAVAKQEAEKARISSGRLSYRERLARRREREEQRRARAAQRPRLTGEELKKHLESYQMEVIRSGQPALPIPLTPEMDDQLVAEGILPPAE